MQQRQQAGGTAWGVQEGKGEEHRRAWERLGKADRSLREREVRVKGEVGGTEGGRTKGTDRQQIGEAQGSGGATDGVGGTSEKGRGA